MVHPCLRSEIDGYSPVIRSTSAVVDTTSVGFGIAIAGMLSYLRGDGTLWVGGCARTSPTSDCPVEEAPPPRPWQALQRYPISVVRYLSRAPASESLAGVGALGRQAHG